MNKLSLETPSPRFTLNYQTIQSILLLLLLVIQVVLQITLVQRIVALEQAFVRVTGPGNQPTPIEVDRIPDERGNFLGPSDAPVTIVEFSDFQCPYCEMAVEPIKKLIAKHPGKIRFIYRYFPLTGIHADAFQSAVASECAALQGKFWEFHDLLFDNQDSLNSESLQGYAQELGLDKESFAVCINSETVAEAVRQDMADGEKYQVTGTPTFFLNNRMVMSVAELEALVAQELTTPQ
jgi:protein-disulfide isomerase